MTPKFSRCIDVILQKEGGFTDNPKDDGNWTGGKEGSGELKGTKYGIAANTFPDEDIKNLSLARAKEIYFEHYWQHYNCESYPLPMALCVFDSYVNTRPSYVQHWLSKSTGYASFMTARLNDYTTFKRWPEFSKGWTRRIMSVLAIAARWDEEATINEDVFELNKVAFNHFSKFDFLKLHIMQLKGEVPKLEHVFRVRKSGSRLDVSKQN